MDNPSKDQPPIGGTSAAMLPLDAAHEARMHTWRRGNSRRPHPSFPERRA